MEALQPILYFDQAFPVFVLAATLVLGLLADLWGQTIRDRLPRQQTCLRPVAVPKGGARKLLYVVLPRGNAKLN